jgi:hypothetical protein
MVVNYKKAKHKPQVRKALTVVAVGKGGGLSGCREGIARPVVLGLLV